MIITTNDFGLKAIEKASKSYKPLIDLMNGEQLVLLLKEHGIGVNRSTLELFDIDENFAVKVESN